MESNRVPVTQFNVLYRLQDGTVQESSFTDITGNIYPKSFMDDHEYPGVGQMFTLKYMLLVPTAFNIMVDTRQEECRQIAIDINELNNRLEFDPQNIQIKKELESLREKQRIN